jgi:hypothetical protein
MAIFEGPLKPDDPIRRKGFLIFHPTPYNPGGEKPGTASSPAKGEEPPQKPKAPRPAINSSDFSFLLVFLVVTAKCS